MSTTNPYAAPSADVSTAPAAVPVEVAKKIRNGWVAACISGTLTLVVTLIAMSGTAILSFSAWSLIDVAVIFGLAFGIYRKSRTCAVLMLVFFVASKIFMMVQSGKPSGLLLAIVFFYYFWQAVMGTFAYHRLKPELAGGAQG